MMENNKRTERVLGSLDGLQKAMAPDFFYTRLTGRMQREEEPVRKPFFLLRPVFITAALSVVLIINIFSLTQLNKKTTKQTNSPATIESFATAYNMNTESVY
jgi:hypothetical protein